MKNNCRATKENKCIVCAFPYIRKRCLKNQRMKIFPTFNFSQNLSTVLFY